MVRPPTEKQSPTQVVRYRPGEAIRWLDGAAEEALGQAKEKASAVTQNGAGWTERIKKVAGALGELGRGAQAELTRRRAAVSEFVFRDEDFTVSRAGSRQTFPYSAVKRFAKDKDKVVVTLAHAALTIRPYAYVVAGKLKVPVGWDRNGSEVPYELLFEEWAARCRLEVVEG
jgi:malonyl CoA-acyl carrier protein transacylase